MRPEDPAHIIACLRSLPHRPSHRILQIRAFEYLRWFSHSYSPISMIRRSARIHSHSAKVDTSDRVADSLAPRFHPSMSSKNNDSTQPRDSPFLLSPVSFLLWDLIYRLFLCSPFFWNPLSISPILPHCPVTTVRGRRVWRWRLRTHWRYSCGIYF